jgi:hypothetical protein
VTRQQGRNRAELGCLTWLILFSHLEVAAPRHSAICFTRLTLSLDTPELPLLPGRRGDRQQRRPDLAQELREVGYFIASKESAGAKAI